MAAVAGMPRTATVAACGPVTARVVSHEALRAFQLRCPDAAVEPAGIVSERLRWADNRARARRESERRALIDDLAERLLRRDAKGLTVTAPDLADDDLASWSAQR